MLMPVQEFPEKVKQESKKRIKYEYMYNPGKEEFAGLHH